MEANRIRKHLFLFTQSNHITLAIISALNLWARAETMTVVGKVDFANPTGRPS